MTDLPPFDANDYRKRVLAAVEKRGGPDTSDPFELYDLPLADDLDDDAVAARIAEVWGAWQRQRDHPKYRVIVALLVERHAELSAELLDRDRRGRLAARVRDLRARRDAARYEQLDAAIARLVERHGRVPEEKVEGLHEIGALAGLSRAEVAARLRRPSGTSSERTGISTERRRQIRALLDEYGRLIDEPAPATLLTLLGLATDATEKQVGARLRTWRGRARELPPERLRAVVDELLVHVADLIEPGRAAIETYLDAVALDVTEHLRPRVRAAVLVEDRLTAADHARLLDEAIDLGLDRARAGAVLAALAAELGVPIDAVAPPPPPPWEEPLQAARAALAAGRPVEAQELIVEAEKLTGGEPVRAVAAEIAAVLADAQRRWRLAAPVIEARRWAEVLHHLEHLLRTAADVAGPDGVTAGVLLDRARAEVEKADRAVGAAVTGDDTKVVPALLAVLTDCPGHPGALAALDRIPVAPPQFVSAVRDHRGDVLVLWGPSPTAAVSYQVSRRRSNGSWQVIGHATGTSWDDGAAPPGVEVPVYAVTAVLAGRHSAPRWSTG